MTQPTQQMTFTHSNALLSLLIRQMYALKHMQGAAVVKDVHKMSFLTNVSVTI